MKKLSWRCFGSLLILLFLTLPVLAGDNAGSAAFIPVYRNRIDEFRNETLPVNGKPVSIVLPRSWYISPSQYGPECKFSRTDNGFLIVSPDNPCSFSNHAGSFTVMNNDLRIEWQITGVAGESRFRSHVIDIGLNRNSVLASKEITIRKGEKRTVSIDASFLDSYAQIRPFISVQGAVEVNAFSLSHREHPEYTVVEGEITERSQLPDPAKSDYPDCRFTASFKGNAILAGPACRKEIALCFDGFEKFKTLPFDKIRKGSKVLLTLKLYDELSAKQKSVQQADDLNLFELDNYYVVSACLIPKYMEDPLRPSSGTAFFRAEV